MPAQYRAIWSVLGGGTGYSVFHASNPTDAVDAQEFADGVRAFFNAILDRLPNDVSITFDSEVVQLADDGTLVAVFPVTAPAIVVGSGTGNYSRAAGGRIDWATGAIAGGRRITGRTYIVPIVAAEFDASGLLTSACIADLQAAADALISGLLANGVVLSVWSRKNASTHPVVTASIPAKGAILRSRRD